MGRFSTSTPPDEQRGVSAPAFIPLLYQRQHNRGRDLRRYLPLIAVIAVAAILLFSGWREIRLADSRAAVIAAEVDARWAQALLARSRRLHLEAVRSADSIQADAATRVARADVKLALSHQALASFVASIESAPDTCKPDLAKAAVLVQEAQSVALEYRKGYESEHKAAQGLRVALDSAGAALAVAGGGNEVGRGDATVVILAVDSSGRFRWCGGC
jgi:hypothetical protein